MAKQVTINLSFNTSNGSYSLSSTDTSLATISADKKSYIVKGKTYTPTVSKSSIVNALYRLNSYQFPSASTVGTSSRGGTSSGTPNTTSDYTSAEVNYYTSHTTSPTYDYETASISCNSSTGTVSGDTDACSYSTTHDTERVSEYSFGRVTWDRTITLSNASGTLQSSSGTNSGSTRSSATYRMLYIGGSTGSTTRTFSVSINTSTGIVSGTGTSYCDYTIKTSTVTENTNYRFSSVSWDSSWNGYTKYGSPSGGAGSTSASQQYRRQTSSGSTTYNPNIYAKFTFDSSTGDISWSFRGTGSTNTTYTNKIKNNSTFDIDDVSTTTYTHNSTDWNADDLTIVSQSKTSITISVPAISWKFTNKDGTTSTGSIIKFIDKNGVETIIGKLNEEGGSMNLQ